MKTFLERKNGRTEYYLRYIYGWKLRECTACSGSGYYDHNGSPRCGNCDGTGKERFRDTDVDIKRLKRQGRFNPDMERTT